MTEYKKFYSRIQELLNDLKQEERNITFHEFLQRLNVSEEVYIMALRSALKKKTKVFLKQQVQDMYINSYMKGMLSAWQANHDIQFVLNVYICIIYICDYMTKAQKGISDLLATACREAREGNMTLKENI